MKSKIVFIILILALSFSCATTGSNQKTYKLDNKFSYKIVKPHTVSTNQKIAVIASLAKREDIALHDALFTKMISDPELDIIGMEEVKKIIPDYPTILLSENFENAILSDRDTEVLHKVGKSLGVDYILLFHLGYTFKQSGVVFTWESYTFDNWFNLLDVNSASVVALGYWRDKRKSVVLDSKQFVTEQKVAQEHVEETASLIYDAFKEAYF